jgi:hypothetical protein
MTCCNGAALKDVLQERTIEKAPISGGEWLFIRTVDSFLECRAISSIASQLSFRWHQASHENINIRPASAK